MTQPCEELELAKKVQNNGNRLEDAIATLIQNQASFLSHAAETDRRHAESEREIAGIKSDIAVILRVLAEHGRLLEQLPEAIREKIGFKGQ